MCFSNVKVEIIDKDNFYFDTVKVINAEGNQPICGIDLRDIDYVNF